MTSYLIRCDVSTSMRRRYVASTSLRRYFNVVCLLGLICKINVTIKVPYISCRTSRFSHLFSLALHIVRDKKKYVLSKHTGPTTPAGPCEDKLPNCASFGQYVCESKDYIAWVNTNCRRFCGICSKFSCHD